MPARMRKNWPVKTSCIFPAARSPQFAHVGTALWMSAELPWLWLLVLDLQHVCFHLGYQSPCVKINRGDMAGPHYAKSLILARAPCTAPLDFTEAAGQVESGLGSISSKYYAIPHLPNDAVLSAQGNMDVSIRGEFSDQLLVSSHGL